MHEGKSWNASIDSFGCPIEKEEDDLTLSDSEKSVSEDDEPKRDYVSKMIKLASFKYLWGKSSNEKELP